MWSAIGGAGMSAIATVLATMGHEVSGSDLKSSSSLARLRSLGVIVTVGHAADNLPDRLDALTVSTAIPTNNPEVVAAKERRIAVLRRAETLAAIAATRQTVAVAGTHGKTTTSSMLALVLSEAGFHPVVHHRRRGDRDRHWRGVGRPGRPFSWSKPTRATVPLPSSCPRGGGGGDQRRARPPRALRRSSPLLRAAFARVPGRDARSACVTCADDVLAAGWAWPRGPSPTATSDDADYRMDALTCGRSRSGFTLHHDGVDLGRIELPIAGAHNARNAAAAVVTALELGRARSRPPRGRAGPLCRRGPSVRAPWPLVAGITFIDDYAHPCPPKSPPRWPRPERGTGTGSCASSTRSATAEPPRSGPSSPEPSGTQTCWRSPTSIRPGKRRAPACPASWSRRRCSTPTRGDASPTCPGVPIWSPTSAASCAPATSASPWVPGISRRCPRTCRSSSTRRWSCPTPGAEVSDPAELAAAQLGDRARADVSLGPARRPTGSAVRPRCWMRVDDEEGLAALAAAVASSGVEVLVVGRGSNLLVADDGFAGLAVRLGEAFAGVGIGLGHGRVVARGSGDAPVGGPAGAAAAGLSRLRVGRRGARVGSVGRWR